MEVNSGLGFPKKYYIDYQRLILTLNRNLKGFFPSEGQLIKITIKIMSKIFLLPVVFLKGLHEINKRTHSFLGGGIVNRGTAATHRPVTF